jgi:hypothetical protein
MLATSWILITLPAASDTFSVISGDRNGLPDRNVSMIISLFVFLVFMTTSLLWSFYLHVLKKIHST